MTSRPRSRIGALWVITSGLKSGDRVVIEGLQKIRPGMKVSVQIAPIEEDADKPGSDGDKGGEKGTDKEADKKSDKGADKGSAAPSAVSAGEKKTE